MLLNILCLKAKCSLRWKKREKMAVVIEAERVQMGKKGNGIKGKSFLISNPENVAAAEFPSSSSSAFDNSYGNNPISERINVDVKGRN